MCGDDVKEEHAASNTAYQGKSWVMAPFVSVLRMTPNSWRRPVFLKACFLRYKLDSSKPTRQSKAKVAIGYTESKVVTKGSLEITPTTRQLSSS